jgi:L-asparaginase II
MSTTAFERAVEITRGDLVESVHAAAVAVCDPDGRLIASLGDPERPVYLRSSAKPYQAAAVVLSGAVDRYGLDERHLAVMAGSHAGEPHHVEAVGSMLERAGIEPAALRCGTHAPFHRGTAEALWRSGQSPTPLMNNCSGKHAGMLAAARIAGHPLESYLDRSHPVQRANLEAVSTFSGLPAAQIPVAVDGCTAPTFSVPLRAAATAFARLARGLASPEAASGVHAAAARVAAAMRSRPEMVAGDGMLDTELMRALTGSVAKVGADGVHALAWTQSADGPIGVAVKVMDGETGRARSCVVVEVLRQIGAFGERLPPPGSITASFEVRNLNGIHVGEVRPVFTLRRSP